MRKFLVIFFSVLIVGAVFYTFRMPILRSFATVLIHEDKLEKSDAIVVLSGGGFDRGNEAVKLFMAGYAPRIICTGGNPATELRVFDIDTLESDLTVANLRRCGIPDSAIIEIKQGTSTKEEANLIERYCIEHNYKRLIIVSSKLHTHRVNSVFRKRLNRIGVELIVRGCNNSRFDELSWWQSEDGLIAVNNEWVKTFYYLIKY